MQPKTNMGDTPEDCLVDLSDTLEKLQEGLRKRTREDFMQTQAIQDFKEAQTIRIDQWNHLQLPDVDRTRKEKDTIGHHFISMDGDSLDNTDYESSKVRRIFEGEAPESQR